MSENPADALDAQARWLRSLAPYRVDTEFRSLAEGLLAEQGKLLDPTLPLDDFIAISAQVDLYRLALDAWFAARQGQPQMFIEQ